MKEISRHEFNQLKLAAYQLPYYWYRFRRSNSPGKINFIHSFFIRQFIITNRYAKLTELDRQIDSPYLYLPKEDYDCLTQCQGITKLLHGLINGDSPSD